ncbi:calcium/manganese antiporter SLC30A10-like isoform 1-T2 [Discoglossus pictus]
MKSLALLPTFALFVLLTQIILSRLSDSLLALSDSANTLSLLITLLPPLILAHSPSSLPPYARIRLPILFSLLAPLLLSSLSLSLALGSLGRLVRPHSPHRPILVIVGGVLGLVFNILYIGAQPKGSSRKKTSEGDLRPSSALHDEDSHGGLPRQLRSWRILVSLIPSILLLSSGLALHLVFDSHALRYMDPALCLSSVVIMVASVYSSMVQHARLMLQAVPPFCNLSSLKQELESLCGPEGHHELHVWEVAPDQAVASLHLCCQGPEAYQTLLDQTKLLFGRHGIGQVTVQPEFGASGACTLACDPGCVRYLCCGPKELEIKAINGLEVTNSVGETSQLRSKGCDQQLTN